MGERAGEADVAGRRASSAGSNSDGATLASLAIHTICVYNEPMKSNVQRVNITLPLRTLRQIDRIAERGDRSQLIDAAVNFYINERSRIGLRMLVKEGALARAGRDRATVELFDLSDTWGM